MNQLTAKPTKGGTNRSISEIMSIPAFKNKLQTYIDEAHDCKTKIATHQATIKNLREIAEQELGLKPALFNAYLTMTFNNDYVERLDKLDELTTLVKTVMSDAQIEYQGNKDD